MCPEKVKRDEGFGEEGGGGEGGDNPQNDPGHQCPPPAYLGQTIFRGSLILRSGPDKDKDRRDGGVDRRSWGKGKACYQRGVRVRAGGKKGDGCGQLRAEQRR